MNIAFVLEVLGRIGFSNILLTEDTKILELQELLAENQVNHQTFVEYISNPEAEGVKELCAEPEFVELLLRSFTKHEFVIPEHIEPNQSYEMVRAKDR